MSILIYTLMLFPLIGSLVIFTMPKSRSELFRPIAIFLSIIPFGLCLYLFTNSQSKGSFVNIHTIDWIKSYGISLTFGISGMSLLLLFLTAVLMLLSFLSVGEKYSESKGFIGSILVLHFAVNGVFLSGDLLSLFIFFEALLIPMYFLMGIWGGENRKYATIKFIIYTVFGSVFIFIGTVYAGVISYGATGRLALDFATLSSLTFTSEQSRVLFLMFTFGFLIKVPIFPLHTWLPDAHVEAPTAGSVLLAAILLKMAGYGFIRFSLGLFPVASEVFTPLIYALSVIAIIVTSLIALMQEDMKKLIAYSSVAHMGFVTLGVFTIQQQGIEGSIIQMISHGLVSAALFLCVGVVYDRMHSRLISSYGGIVTIIPKYSILFMIFTLAALGLPGTSGFVGEFLILMAVFKDNFLVAVLASIGVILGAAYMLWLYKRVIFGKLINSDLKSMMDLDRSEYFILTCLAIPTLYFGFYPDPLINTIEVSVNDLIDMYNKNLLIK